MKLRHAISVMSPFVQKYTNFTYKIKNIGNYSSYNHQNWYGIYLRSAQKTTFMNFLNFYFFGILWVVTVQIFVILGQIFLNFGPKSGFDTCKGYVMVYDGGSIHWKKLATGPR